MQTGARLKSLVINATLHTNKKNSQNLLTPYLLGDIQVKAAKPSCDTEAALHSSLVYAIVSDQYFHPLG